MQTQFQELEENSHLNFDPIFKPLVPALKSLDFYLDSQIACFEPELRDLVRYSLEHKGKRLRPLFVFYSGWQDDKAISEDLIKVAAIIELVHQATLIHDDILDEASIRHKVPTLFKKYGSKIAVLLGDALFSHALVLASEFESREVCSMISKSIKRVCAGEIKQTFQSFNNKHTAEDYYKVIELKTADLFYVSCFLGARLMQGNDAYVNAVAEFGRNIGIAYQIYDDLIDILENENNIGKTLGTDFINGKHTLPTIRLLERLDNTKYLEFINNLNNKNINPSQLKLMFNEYGIIDTVFNELKARIKDAGLCIAQFYNLPSFPYLENIQMLFLSQIERLQSITNNFD